MNNGFYPIVIYPTLLNQFCTENPLPEFERDATPKLIFSVPPRKSQFDKRAYFWVLYIWTIGVAVIVFTRWLFQLSLEVFFLALGCSVISGLAAGYYLKLRDLQAEARYKQGLVEHPQSLSESENRYSRRANLIQIGNQNYSLLLRKRQHKLKVLLNGRVQLPCNASNAQQGVSEKQFFRYLLRYFPTVCQGMEFEIPNCSLCYSADFIVYDPPSGLAVDIEIDEPYEGRTGEPHHCIDQGKDKQRNKFFLDRNWIVIRFSEKQVVLYPESCCKMIADAIAQVTGDRSYLVSFQDVPTLPLDKQWTIKEARRMAKNNYRNSYLPRSIRV